MKKLFIKFITFLKKLFSIFLIFNLTCVSTAQAAAVFVDSFSVNAYNEGNLPDAVAFNNNGTKMFVTGSNGQAVNEYTLTTGFDVSTATYAGDDERFDISNEETWPSGLAFNNDGTKMFVVGRAGDDVSEYTLTTGFDVSTASFFTLTPPLRSFETTSFTALRDIASDLAPVHTILPDEKIRVAVFGEPIRKTKPGN